MQLICTSNGGCGISSETNSHKEREERHHWPDLSSLEHERVDQGTRCRELNQLKMGGMVLKSASNNDELLMSVDNGTVTYLDKKRFILDEYRQSEVWPPFKAVSPPPPQFD